jgi:DNA helicase-2/ATP-dependent DNA helicase PcrA
MDISELLGELNSQQRQAVTAPPGQTLVLAGPGSGKTRVLTFRAAYLVLARGVRPFHILAVTFTNKAAREMGSRLERLLGADDARSLWLGTFHAMCARILRREVSALPLQENFVIFDSDDQETIVKTAIRELNVDEKLYRPGSVHAAISDAKNRLLRPQDYPVVKYRDEVVARIYQRYQDLLVANNGVDFDDLLMYGVFLLEEHPDLRQKYGQRFEHLLVDEFQDTNIAQYKLLQLLAGVHHNLFVVGDEDQSIYRWRGADYRNVLRFEEDYAACQKILLEQNYRSTQTVLDAARAVIDRNPHRTPKNLFTERGRGEKIILYEAGNDHAEADFVVDTIQQSLAAGQAKGSDFAVMYRTNAQSRLLEDAFLRAGVPYRLVGAQRFYGRREVKDLIAYLRLVHNPADEISLRRVINVPPRDIGEKSWDNLRAAAEEAGAAPGEVLLDLGTAGPDSPYWKSFSGRSAMSVANFGERLAAWRQAGQALSLPELFDRIVADTRYQAYIDDGSDEGADRWENVLELRRLAFDYQDRGLTLFLENLALVSDQDTLPPEGVNAPTLLTLHAAKGLEFPQVFIIGLDEKLLPHSRSLDEPEEMYEERRLLYVGMTRAKNRLYLVRADQRTTFGSYEDSVPSRFLDDLPDELIQRLSPRRYGRESYGGFQGRRERQSRWRDDTLWQSRPTRASSGRNERSERPPARQPEPPRPAAVVQKYQVNMRVRHPSWGEGLVIDSRILDGEELVDVFFESVGFKRLMASLARLEIIN